MNSITKVAICLTALSLLGAGCSRKPNTTKTNPSTRQAPVPTNTTNRTDNNPDLSSPDNPPTQNQKPNTTPRQTLAPGQTPRSNTATATGRKEAINEFKARPLYEATSLDKTMNSTWYTSAKKYPERGAYMWVVYSPSDTPRPKEVNDGFNRLSEGAVMLEQNLLGAQDFGPCPYQTVKTRDHVACTNEVRNSPTREQRDRGVYGGNVNERTLHWWHKVDEGYLFVQLRVDPDRYSLEQLIALTDDLTVIR